MSEELMARLRCASYADHHRDCHAHCRCMVEIDLRETTSEAADRIATLEAALRDVVDNCGECGGYGTYPAEESVTGKVLWWDCSSPACHTARSALENNN